jgi:glycosyltransferase involved in cell wall biosynthesis
METLRILWLNWRDIANPAAGGAELYTYQIAMRWALEGHEVTLFTSQYANCRREEYKDGLRIVRRGNASSVYLEAPHFLESQNAKGTRYDVIIEGINTIPFFSKMYGRNSLVVALVYQLTGEIFGKELGYSLGGIFRILENRFYAPWYLRKADHVVTLSDSTKNEILILCGLGSEDVSVVPPGVDHDTFGPGPKSEIPLLLFMNRLVKYKQPDHLILGMNEILSQVPKAKLVIVGTPSGERYKAYLRQLVRTNGLEAAVSFLLPKPFAWPKKALLQQAWIHVLPSVKEGFGLSILESAACGTPTVGYDVAGVRDAVIPNKTGILVEPDNRKALSEAIVRILTDEELRSQLGRNAVCRAAGFRWAKSANQFMEALRTLVP